MKVRKCLMKLLYNFALVSFLFNSMVFAGGSVTLGGEVIDVLEEVTQILLVVAGGVCVGKVIHIGILYVSSVAADKSNAKSAILPWLIGTFVCFGAAIIGPAIIGIFSSGAKANVLDY